MTHLNLKEYFCTITTHCKDSYFLTLNFQFFSGFLRIFRIYSLLTPKKRDKVWYIDLFPGFSAFSRLFNKVTKFQDFARTGNPSIIIPDFPESVGTLHCSLTAEHRDLRSHFANGAMRHLLPPANEVCEGYVFTGVCLSTTGGHAWLLWGGMHDCSGGRAWLLHGGVWFFLGGMHGFCWGCMVFSGGCAWFFPEGMHGFFWGACMVFSGGHACFFLGGWHACFWGGMRGFFRDGGHAWFLGGMRGFSGMGGYAWFWGGMHGFFRDGGACVGYDEIRSMSGRYASYWNAFLLKLSFLTS